MLPGPISRRHLLGGGAAALLLAACGGKSGSDGASGGDAATSRQLVAFFSGSESLVPGRPQRVTFGVAGPTGALVTNGPGRLTMTITPVGGGKAIGPISVPRHDSGLPRSYYPVTFTPPTAGSYEVAARAGDEDLTSAFDIGRKELVKVPGAGDPMPKVDTPTTADHQGVDPICTRDPACPLHAVNLRDALAANQRVALLVSTPAYCQTAICGPVLDVLLAQQAAFPTIRFIHAEVYASAKDAEANGANAKLAPVLEALQLSFEPALFLIGADGTIAQRLDVIFDAVELRQHLSELRG